MGDSVYEQVQQLVRQIIAEITDANATAMIHAGAVARAAYQSALSDDANVPITVEWTSVEQFKQIARRELRGKYGHESEENEVYQGDMFSGHLQKYYPVKVGGDEDPFYKLRELLTDDEIDQNLLSLKKQADARLVHYDALLAYKVGRQAGAA